MNQEKTIEEIALQYAIHHSSAPDKETPDWIIADWMAGYNYRNKEVEELKKEIEELTMYRDNYKEILIQNRIVYGKGYTEVYDFGYEQGYSLGFSKGREECQKS